MNAKAGEPLTPITKHSQAAFFETIRIWRKQTMSRRKMVLSKSVFHPDFPSAPPQSCRSDCGIWYRLGCEY
jgi:hypothetical protein